ncbi:MAG: EAL and HDOD domain-containing protein [Vibrio litoralis]|uniref:EAL and HDOD domain-containing protein n=1 Tax=Vibrio litoralis TaxID=335972 RepID=UPI003F9A0F0C
MYSFIARQPIVNTDKQIVAYELLFREGFKNEFPSVDPQLATSRLLIEHFFLTNAQGHEKTLYLVNFPYQSLIEQIPTLFPADLLMIEILEDCQPSDELFSAIRAMHQQGYKIALDDFIPSPGWERFLPYICTIKFDIQQVSISDAAKFIETHKAYDLYYLAEKIENQQELEEAKKVGFDFFQGYALHEPEIIKHRRIESSSFTVDQLKIAINQSPVDYQLIERLIRYDITMTYKLMRFINAHSSKTFTTFEDAFNILGLDKIKLFIELSLTAAHKWTPSDYYLSSMHRAHFCEQVAALDQFKINAEHAYFVGMFSQIDKLLQQPLAHLVETLPLNKAAINALSQQQGILGDILGLAIAYEKKDDSSIQWFADKLQISPELARQFYDNAINWVTPENYHLRLEGKLLHQQ